MSKDRSDGFLSDYAEIHAASRGMYDGMRNWQARPKEYPQDEDIQKEKHYYAGGYIVGTLLQAGLALLLYYLASRGVTL